MNSNKSSDDIIQREKDGTLKDTITHAHVFILSRSAFRSLQNTLYDKFSDGAPLILYDMGEGYGNKLGSAFMRNGLGIEQTMKEIENIAFLAGWGKIHFRVIDKSLVECTVENSMFSLERKGVTNSCYFLAGILGGNWTGMHKNQRFFAKEVECSISGHRLCKFEIEESQS